MSPKATSKLKLILLPQAIQDLNEASEKKEVTRWLEGRYLPQESIIQVFQATSFPTQQSFILGKWFLEHNNDTTLPSNYSLYLTGTFPRLKAFWHTIPLPPQNIVMYDLHRLFDRVQPILDLPSLQKKQVMIVGLGSLGSRVALELAKSGVGSLTLIDHDIIEPENLVRHITSIHDLGRFKVHAIKDKIENITPNININVITSPILEDNLSEFTSLVKRHDLVVVALGPHEANTLLDDVLHEAKTPGVYAGVFRKGIGGTIIWVKPFETACYTCVFNTLTRKGILQQAFHNVNHNFSLKDLSETRQDYGLGRIIHAEPALNIDISIIALIQAKIALYLLQDSPLLNYIGQAIVVILGTEQNLHEKPTVTRKIISTGHLDKIPAKYCQHHRFTEDFSIEDL